MIEDDSSKFNLEAVLFQKQKELNVLNVQYILGQQSLKSFYWPSFIDSLLSCCTSWRETRVIFKSKLVCTKYHIAIKITSNKFHKVFSLYYDKKFRVTKFKRKTCKEKINLKQSLFSLAYHEVYFKQNYQYLNCLEFIC